jgi:hypothetical protein
LIYPAWNNNNRRERTRQYTTTSNHKRERPRVDEGSASNLDFAFSFNSISGRMCAGAQQRQQSFFGRVFRSSSAALVRPSTATPPSDDGYLSYIYTCSLLLQYTI